MELVISNGFCEMSEGETMEAEGGAIGLLGALGTLAAVYVAYEVSYAVGKGIVHLANAIEEATTPESEVVELVPEPIR